MRASIPHAIPRRTPGYASILSRKVGEADGRLYIEVHADVYRRVGSLEREAFRVVHAAHVDARIAPERLRAAVRERLGIPVDVTREAPPAL